MSILSEWCSSGKAKLSDFETDPSFIRLCRILTKGVHIKPEPKFTVKSEDLSVVTNVAADDEAAKLVGGISLPQMVKVPISVMYLYCDLVKQRVDLGIWHAGTAET